MVFLENDMSKLQAGPEYTSFPYFIMDFICTFFSYLLMIQNRYLKILKYLIQCFWHSHIKELRLK
jgi:hypothetical protein